MFKILCNKWFSPCSLAVRIFSIFTAGVRVNQANAKLFNNVGHSLENEQRWDQALLFFRHAAAVQPDDIGAHINVGRTYKSLQR